MLRIKDYNSCAPFIFSYGLFIFVVLMQVPGVLPDQ